MLALAQAGSLAVPMAASTSLVAFNDAALNDMDTHKGSERSMVPERKSKSPSNWQCQSKSGERQKVAYIHIPKTGGESVLYSLKQAGAGLCNGGTKLEPNDVCQCHKRWYEEGFPDLAGWNSKAVCGSSAEIAVMEQTHESFFNYWDAQEGHAECTAWMSTIRDPQEWFYSAVGQWCTRSGAGTPACGPDATYDILRNNLSWWNGQPLANARAYDLNHPQLKYYFAHDNLQTTMLGDIFREPNWAICTLNNFVRVLNAVPHLLRSQLQENRVPKHVHQNKQHWEGLPSFKTRVPWGKVKQHYKVDQRFYDDILRHGCSMRTRDQVLGTVLSKHRFEVFNGAIPQPTQRAGVWQDLGNASSPGIWHP